MVLYGDLADAVRRESQEAVMRWWGVGSDTVWNWRKALGVGAINEGTRALKSDVLAPVLERAREVALPTLSSPERREKAAAARGGEAAAGARDRGDTEGADGQAAQRGGEGEDARGAPAEAGGLTAGDL